MTRNLALILVVVLRLIGLYLIANGLFGWLAGLLLTGGNMGMPLVAFLLPIFKGVLLWFVAKPCAILITRDLE